MAQNVLDYFIQQASCSPDNMAVVSDNKRMTYRQLDEASSRLCALLRQRGVRPGDYLPLVALRTPELLVGILAIVKAGAGYIPIDARYPLKRIQDIADQSGSPLIVATNSTIELADNKFSGDIIYADNISTSQPIGPRLTSPPANAVVYLIFTSGTTGKPKGVLIEHHSLLNLILWHNQEFAMDAGSRSTLIAGLSFDVAQWEIWAPLTSGGTLYLPEEETRLRPEALLAWFAEHRITHAGLPAVLVPEAIAAPQPAALALKYLFSSGEKLQPVALRGINYAVVDYYGPTEATIFATCNRVDCATQNPPASIGRPVADTQVFILDDELQPVSGDQSGELYISGRCLARGYLNSPQLTAERFITPPHFNGKRLYRSGDRARWLPDGRIQFLGRLDDQVKIRGNRIELGEIENLMSQVAGVKMAVAVVTQAEELMNKRIVAFLVAERRDDDPIARVKQKLQESLPAAFLPADYRQLEQLPLNINGKTDKAALLADYQPAIRRAAEPLTASQQTVATLWQNLLKQQQIGADDDFFALGGHSLLAARLATALGEKFSVKTYVRDIYEYPTIRRLAQALDDRGGQRPPAADNQPDRGLQHEVQLPKDIVIDPQFDMRQIAAPRAMLLTGATGFVGSHLLAELLATTDAELYCLIRDNARKTPLQRLEAVLKRYRIELAPEQRQRIHIVPGNVAEPDLALSPDAYQALSRTIDVVYHSASSVNFIQPYAYMKRDNVQGLCEIIRFAAHRRTKPLMLLSTISVYSWGHRHTGKKVMLENDDIDQNLQAVNADIGYVRSKWVMEKMADLAAARGLPLMTFRLGYATCHSRTGVNADYQWWGRLVKTCISSGTVPDLQDLREGLTTVDYMTRAIAHISRNPQALGNKFNLIHRDDNNLTLRAFFALLEHEFGYRFRPLPYSQWVAQWEHNDEAPLYPLLSLFKDIMADGQSTVELYQNTYRWDCGNLQRFLQGSGIDEPRFTRQMLSNYLQHAIGYPPPL
ncbi:amino acid adenylation domain-containing protein [Serratia ficaria]|uniref:amino acid adenylation domain-containing protein n=1 Tax=Serratia ficaria TaxID=61651 RepID=UPI002183CCC8|nr:amino acid adenylation domain-containing protein [Serratia ficaria]CAI2525863.1 Linear gramicidin synthase subunit D [Serratia ficaria]